MPRLRHVASGSVVSVSEETAELLGSDWEPVEEPKSEKVATRKPAARKTQD